MVQSKIQLNSNMRSISQSFVKIAGNRNPFTERQYRFGYTKNKICIKLHSSYNATQTSVDSECPPTISAKAVTTRRNSRQQTIFSPIVQYFGAWNERLRHHLCCVCYNFIYEWWKGLRTTDFEETFTWQFYLLSEFLPEIVER